MAAQIEVQLAGAKHADGRFIFGPEVRVECLMRSETKTCHQRCDIGETEDKQGVRWTRQGCPNCHGRGWGIPIQDRWEEAAVAAGASVMRAWWNRSAEVWMAEARLVGCHRPSSVAEGGSPRGTRIAALEMAVQAIPGAQLGK